MESKEDEESTQERTPPQDAKNLVTALTQLLLDESPGTSDTITARALSVPSFLAGGANTSTRFLESQRPSSSSNDDEGFLPLPGFLADSQVRMALRQAAVLHNQGPLPDASPSHVSPPFAQHPRFQREREMGAHIALDFHPSLGPSGYPTSTYVPLSPAHLHPRDPVSGSSGIPDKFAPGKETESVLKLTKRPKLRAKDISHRHSLGGM